MLFYYDIYIHELPKKCKAEQIITKIREETELIEMKFDKIRNLIF